MESKIEIFTLLDKICRPTTILASNTSSLSVTEIASVTYRAKKCVGMHFFNPVNRMKLIEVVVGQQTSDQTRERTLAFARQVGKVPVIVRDSPGFLVNRVLFPYLLDAAELFENGESADKIDSALLSWGMPMGPLRLIDEIGVDITVDIADTLSKAYGQRDESPQILREMLSAKSLGRKSGSGFYKYEGKQQIPNDAVEQWRKAKSANEDADPGNRLVFLMVNEAARCLEEKVVESPEDADYGMILGTGFAPTRGGPLRFADHFGIKKLVEEIERLAQKNEKFTPCEILKKHARDGTKFYEDR